jgi:hypothetical protein
MPIQPADPVARSANVDTPLAPLGPEIWVKRAPLRFFGFPMGTRMTVMRLAEGPRAGSLFVHSPTPLDHATQAAVDALGPVRIIVAPNRLHHLFVGDWAAAYPQAELWGATELMKKRADIAWTGVLADAPEPAWAADIDQCLFKGSLFQEEAVFLHRRSKTLILVDLFESVWPEDAWPYRAFARLAGTWKRPATTYDQRLMFTLKRGGRAAARAAAQRILGWDFDKIVLAHGRLVLEDGKRVFREGMRWVM